MGDTPSARVRANMKYNKKTYTQIKVDVPKEMAEAFRFKCEECGVSQRSILLEAIEQFLERGVIKR